MNECARCGQLYDETKGSRLICEACAFETCMVGGEEWPLTDDAHSSGQEDYDLYGEDI